MRSLRQRGAIGGASALAGLLCASLLATPASSAVSAPSTAAGTATPAAIHAADVASKRPSHPLPYQNPRLSTQKRVKDLLNRMTLAEKIGQMAQAERADVAGDPSQIAELGLGSVLSGGGSTPAENTPEAWADTVDAFQEQALSTRLGIPLLYGVDSVHGHGNLLGATVFPHNIGLGATRDPKLAERIGHITAEETRASGPQWNFSPCVCVARDDRWGRTYESFGENPKLAAEMSRMIEGLQGRRGQLDRPDRVLATAKHFAGDGFTVFGTGEGDYTVDQGITQASRSEFAKLALSPYVTAIKKHDVGSVMPSFSSVDWTEDGLGNPVKMHAHKELVTGWLKQKQGFDGLVISDWRAIHQIPGTYAEQVAASVNAGVDLFMEPFSGDTVGYPQFIETLTAAVEDGTVPMARINDAVARILTAKFELGLFEKPFTDRRNIDDIGSPAHRRVAREAVSKSQVLLKNSHHALPLSGRDDVYVAGSKADSIGDQAGGWTITWQGNSTHQIPGDTILDGIESSARGEVTHSSDASAPVPAGAHGVVVVGEHPYAEGFGDVGGPQWGYDPGENGVLRPPLTMHLSDADTEAIETVCAAAATCTVLVVSGRPLIIPPELLGQIDALVASWLPGSEGKGVADVLFGKRPFTGKLPVTWPRSIEQEPINIGDSDYDPLFAYGYGLRTRR